MVAQLRKKERGVALLAVLLGIALMTLVVMDFAMTSGLGFVSAANQANEMRAGYLARSGINVGLGLLAADARTKAQAQASTPVEALTDAWATPFPPIPLEGGTVTLSIVDEARKININSMVQNNVPQPLAIQRVQRLFTVLDVNVQLVQGIVDWITPNSGAALQCDADDRGLADGRRIQRSNFQPREPVPDRDARAGCERQHRVPAGASGARAAIDGR
jgi:general secretion pathway protein K